jgi:hypothetical protein
MIDEMEWIGRKFGQLTIVKFSGRDKHRHILYNCKCDCGREKIASRSSLKNGDTKTCGCRSRNKSLIHKRAEHQKRMEENRKFTLTKEKK